MSAIEELRKLLDERGVAHSDHYLSTTWRDRHRILHLASEPMADGSLVVDMLTPEQAVIATLNSRAEQARNISDPPEGFLCSNCGWGDFAEPSHLLTTAKFTGKEKGPNYCPNCGARIE